MLLVCLVNKLSWVKRKNLIQSRCAISKAGATDELIPLSLEALSLLVIAPVIHTRSDCKNVASVHLIWLVQLPYRFTNSATRWAPKCHHGRVQAAKKAKRKEDEMTTYSKGE